MIDDTIAIPLFIVAVPLIGLYRLLKGVFYDMPKYIISISKDP